MVIFLFSALSACAYPEIVETARQGELPKTDRPRDYVYQDDYLRSRYPTGMLISEVTRSLSNDGFRVDRYPQTDNAQATKYDLLILAYRNFRKRLLEYGYTVEIKSQNGRVVEIEGFVARKSWK